MPRKHARIAALACLPVVAACADLSRPPLFPPGAAEEPIVQEQALLGLAPQGDAVAAELLLAEGSAPRLSLLRLDKSGVGPQVIEAAPPAVARAVAARLLAQGETLEPLLGAAVAALWPQALKKAAALGFPRAAPAIRGPDARLRFAGSAPGRLPLALTIAADDASPPAQVLLLSEVPGGRAAGDAVVLARMPLSGRTVAPQLDAAGGVAWMLAGSVLGSADGKGGPLRRTVGLRQANLARGEAELHRRHGFTDLRLGVRASARREFDRAVAADPLFADALYDAAAAAARDADAEGALTLLRRAARVDPRRVQVLGRDDGDLGDLRLRPEVRALLGLGPVGPSDAGP
jgi:tetratricopeptide (TPR) repeat protein